MLLEVSIKQRVFKEIFNILNLECFLFKKARLKEKKKIKIHDYITFEQIQKESAGGGLLTALHKNLEPVSVCDKMNDDEILVVETKFTVNEYHNDYGL